VLNALIAIAILREPDGKAGKGHSDETTTGSGASHQRM